MEQQPWWTTSLLIIEFSRSHSDTSQSVDPLRTSDQLVAEASIRKHTHNSHNRQTVMSPAAFEPAIPTSERPNTHALDDAANEIGR
jgi:hypothetical protein